jgi:hypothetical protein
MLFKIIIFFIILIIAFLLTYKKIYEDFSIPDQNHITYETESKDKFNQLTNLVNLTNPALPLNMDSQIDVNLSLNGVNTVPTKTGYSFQPTHDNIIPVAPPANFQKAQMCESKPLDCGAFDDPDFAANCGMSFDKSGTSLTGKPHIGGKFISQQDRTQQLSKMSEADSQGQDSSIIPKPTLGSSKPGTFALTKDKCNIIKETIECQHKQSFNSPNCTQCYTSQSFHRVDPATSRLPSTLYLFGNGDVTVSSNNNVIYLPKNVLNSTDAATIAVPPTAEGTQFTINVSTGADGKMPSLSGYIEGQTSRGPFKLDIMSLIDKDTNTGVKPKIGGSSIVNGFRSFILLPTSSASGKNQMNLSCMIPFSFIGVTESDARGCDNGPIITQAASATFLESDPCFGKKNSPGNYTLGCLQERWIELGGTTSGKGYPSDAANANLIQKDKNGNPVDIDAIMNNLYPKMIQASTGQNQDGSFMTIPEWNTVSMWATGTPINTPCDGNTGSLTKECLSYLYSNQGINSHIGATYTLPNSQNASMKGGPSTYCQPDAPLDPMTQTGYDFIKDMKTIDSVKQAYDKINRDANNNTLANKDRSDAIYKCYGVHTDASVPHTPKVKSTINGVFIALSGSAANNNYNNYYADTNLGTSSMNWIQTPGGLTNISLASNGFIFGVNSSGSVLYKNSYKATSNWIALPATDQVYIDNDGTYLVATNKYNTGYYVKISDIIGGNANWTAFPANFIKTVISGGKVYCLGTDNALYYLPQITSQTWVKSPFYDWVFKDLSLDGDVIIMIGNDNKIYYSDNNIFTQNATLNTVPNLPAKMKSISLSKGSILAVDVNGNYWYTPDYKNPNWIQLVGSGGVYVSHRMTSTSNPSSTPSVPISTTPSNTCIGTCNSTINNTNNTCKLIMQNDGNLVLRDSNGSSLWASNAPGGTAPYKLTMQNDGNLVVRDSNGSATWASNATGGTAPYKLILQDDCNLVVRDTNNTSIWATNTNVPSNTNNQSSTTNTNIGGIFTALSGNRGNNDYNIYYANKNLLQPSINWTQIPGAANSIALAPNGSMWQTNIENAIYFLPSYNSTNWITIPGSMRNITTDGTYVGGTNNNNNAFLATYSQASQGKWNLLPGSLKQISVSNGKLYGIGMDNAAYYSTGNNWTIQSFNSGVFKFCALDGTIVVFIGTDNKLYYSDSNIFSQNATLNIVPNLPANMQNVSISNGSLLAVDTNGNYWYTSNYKNTNWTKLTGSGAAYVSHRMTSP